MSPCQASDLRAANRVFEEEVVGRGDFGALDRVYTADARILPPGGEMVVGRANLREFWKAAAVQLGVTGVKLNTIEVEFLGDTAIEIGRANIATHPSGGFDVKYVVVWKRQDHAWKWHIDIWNPVS